jgi:hypothetical protein
MTTPMTTRTLFYYLATMACCAINITLGILPLLTTTVLLTASLVMAAASGRR